MQPAHAMAIAPGSWAVETEFGYQNTWAMSRNAELYMTAIESLGRKELGPEQLQGIRDLPGENYLVDLETGSADVTVHYRFSSSWTGYLTASALSYQGGFLDGIIEGFHDTFGLGSFGRGAAKRNDANLIFDLKSAQVAIFEAPTDGGFTDPAIGLRYAVLTLPSPWQGSLEAAVKIPLGGRRLLLSTGRTDFGVQASLQRFVNRDAIYFNAAAVYYAGATQPAVHEAQIIPTLIVGYERQLSARTNVNLQVYASSSVYSRATSDLPELLGEKYQLSVGVRHRLRRVLLTLGITENLHNVHNSADIALHFGVAYIPQRLASAGE
jgi:hypothetical protein